MVREGVVCCDCVFCEGVGVCECECECDDDWK